MANIATDINNSWPYSSITNGASVEFDGSSPTSCNLGFAFPGWNAHTWSAWIKTDNSTQQSVSIVGSVNTAGANTTTRGPIMIYQNKWAFTHGDGAGNYVWDISNPAPVATLFNGQWHDIALTSSLKLAANNAGDLTM